MSARAGAARRGSTATAVKRFLKAAAIVIVVGVLGAVAAGATLTGPTTTKLAGGSVGVSSCGSLTGASVAYLNENSNVVGITVSGLPSTCNGGSLSATLTNNANTNLGGGGPATVSGGVASITSLSASPAATTPTKVFFVVVGP